MRRIRRCVAIYVAAAILVGPVLVQNRDQGGRLVYEHPSSHWFEAPLSRVEIAADGQWALFRRSPAPELANLRSGSDGSRLRAGLDSFSRAMFCGARLLRYGQLGPATSWFFEDTATAETDLPADIQIRCTPTGSRVAYVRTSRPDELVVRGEGVFRLGGRVTAVEFAPGASSVYALVLGAIGSSSLVRIDLQSRRITQVASGLDATRDGRGLAVSPDGRSAYLSLASGGVPRDEDRHRPDANRWLKIYRVDLQTASREVVVESAHDNHSPVIVDGALYWVRNIANSMATLVPSGGGTAKDLVAGEMPSWSADGRRIAFVYGAWRLVDRALNLDASVIEADGRGSASGRPASIVTGYHEDFAPAWSPDGRWIAYHSHRSERPVADYSAPGSTDDIYLRRAGDSRAPELRLTDFGWEAGTPDWAPDGRRLLFTSYEKGGVAGLHKVFVVTLDPVTGKALKHEALKLPPEIRNPQTAAWSPDGRRIAVEDHRGGFDRTLWLVDADGRQAQRVADYRGSSYGGVDWMPDGRTLVYAAFAGERMQLFAATLGGSSKQLTDSPGNLRHPQVSPDGRWIAATRLEQSHQIWMRAQAN